MLELGEEFGMSCSALERLVVELELGLELEQELGIHHKNLSALERSTVGLG